MRNFHQTLTEAIDDLLSKEGMAAVSDLKKAKNAYEEANGKIEDLKNEMNSKLATVMKKILSNIVNNKKVEKNWRFIIGDGVTFKYKSRSITLNPNLEKLTIEISPGSDDHGDVKFYKIFKDLNDHPLSKWKELLENIAEKFRASYKSMQNDEYKQKQQEAAVNKKQEEGEQDHD